MASVKFYINMLIFHLNSTFNDLIVNLIIIFKNYKMILCFIILLPIMYFLIKVQIHIGFLFGVWYILLFLVFFFLLKTEFTISCKEIPLNTSFLKSYVFFNTFFFIPKAKAFIIVYNSLNLIFNNKNKNKFKNILIIVFIFIVVYFIKFSILLFLGYTYLSLLITSDFVISLFNTLSWKYENNLAKFEHILMNCCLDNKNSVGLADEMNIIIYKDTIIFNMQRFVTNFISGVKKPECLQKAFKPELKKVFSKNFIDNHFNFSLSSLKYPEKNISKNLTSSEFIKISNTDKKIKCTDEYNPNLLNQNKSNYLTPTYQLNKEEAVLKQLDKNVTFKMQNFSKNVFNSMVTDKDSKMLFSEKGGFVERSDACTVKEHCKEYKIELMENIKNLDEFETANKSFLETEKGKHDYEIFKNIMKNNVKSDIFKKDDFE